MRMPGKARCDSLLLIAIPDEGCATLLPEWLSEPEFAGKRSIATASFVASLFGTEKNDKPLTFERR
jgi:hypothetical protein